MVDEKRGWRILYAHWMGHHLSRGCESDSFFRGGGSTDRGDAGVFRELGRRSSHHEAHEDTKGNSFHSANWACKSLVSNRLIQRRGRRREFNSMFVPSAPRRLCGGISVLKDQ